jgi:hypothetical protein
VASPVPSGRKRIRATIAFQLAASELLGGEVALFSDEVLHNEQVSPDLLAASPL